MSSSHGCRLYLEKYLIVLSVLRCHVSYVVVLFDWLRTRELRAGREGIRTHPLHSKAVLYRRISGDDLYTRDVLVPNQ